MAFIFKVNLSVTTAFKICLYMYVFFSLLLKKVKRCIIFFTEASKPKNMNTI